MRLFLRRSRTKLVRALGVFAILVTLAACSAGGAPSAAPPLNEVPVAPSPVEAAASPTSAVEAEPTGEQAAAAATESSPADAEPTPTLRVGLQATDPSTVQLANGEPTLVEFFAFW